MKVVRLLKPGVEHPQDESATADTIKGFVAKHFLSNGNLPVLSFYRVTEEFTQPERVALALACTMTRLEDLELCMIPREAIARCGVGFDEGVLGETIWDDVNALHLDVTGVTLNALAGLTVESVRLGKVLTFGWADIAAKILHKTSLGEIDVNALPEKLKNEIENKKSSKAVKRALRLLHVS